MLGNLRKASLKVQSALVNSVVVNRHGIADALGIHQPENFYGTHGTGPLTCDAEELRTVDLFIDKAVFDLDVIAVVGNFRDVHFCHACLKLADKTSDVRALSAIHRVALAIPGQWHDVA